VKNGVEPLSVDQPRHGTNFLWCLRHFAWVLVLGALVGAAIALFVAPSKPTYQTGALVVAKQLTVSEKVLPTLAASVFADGAVASHLASDPAVHGDTSGLIPDRLSVVPGQDSIVLEVQARDSDPASAARLANTAAAAFATELNRGGAGVGQFAVQSQAPVPVSPLREFSQTQRAALGALAGLLLGLGVIALTGVIRRPVVTSRDVASAVGVPLLGTVELQRMKRGSYLGPRGVRGIATVTRWLATVPAGRLTLISSRSHAGMRRRVYVMLAVALSTLRRVRPDAPFELVTAVERHSIERRSAGAHRAPRPEDEAELVIADGGSPLDVADPSLTNVSVVAVAPRGLPRRRLRALAAEFLDGGLVGVVLVQRRIGGRSAAPSPPAAASSIPDQRVPAGSGLPEPERA
jgi:hypothetical protein